MKIKLIGSLIFSALIIGCTNNYFFSNPQYNEPTSLTPAMQNIASKSLGLLVVLNKNEINAATTAQRKAINASVKNYADLMQREHGKNLQETLLLSQKLNTPPQQGPVARSLQQQGKQELAMLNRLNGVAFDKAYINAMVKDHKHALKLVNGLISEANNPRVKHHLEMTRDHIAMHLQQAITIQNSLGR